MGRAKEFIRKMLKKYINPISKALAKAAAALAALLGIIEGLLMVLEMLYMFMLSKCSISGGDNNSTADTNNKGEGTAGDGTGGEDGGDGGNSGLTGQGTKGDQLAALYNMLQTRSPEEIIAQMALRRDDEYIRYIRNARFQTIGYERFNAAVGSLDTTQGVDYPYTDISKNIAPETRIDAKNELPEFPDLVRGNQRNNDLKRNLRINPSGPDPDETGPGTGISSNQSGGSY